MDAEIGPVGAELLGRDGELDRLQQRIGRRARPRLRRLRPMAEGEEADVFHGDVCGVCSSEIEWTVGRMKRSKIPGSWPSAHENPDRVAPLSKLRLLTLRQSAENKSARRSPGTASAASAGSFGDQLWSPRASSISLT